MKFFIVDDNPKNHNYFVQTYSKEHSIIMNSSVEQSIKNYSPNEFYDIIFLDWSLVSDNVDTDDIIKIYKNSNLLHDPDFQSYFINKYPHVIREENTVVPFLHFLKDQQNYSSIVINGRYCDEKHVPSDLKNVHYVTLFEFLEAKYPLENFIKK